MVDIVRLIRKRLKVKTTDQSGPRFWPRFRKATPSSLTADGQALGFDPPPLLKHIYLTVGNGGFGPGYGLIGMTGGTPDDTGKTVPEIYAIFRAADAEEPEWVWPRSLLPVCHWGCGILSCIACDEPDYPMYIFDPNAHDSDPTWRECFFAEAPSFEGWLGDWAQGVNLWDRLYGEAGTIRKGLEQRQNSAT